MSVFTTWGSTAAERASAFSCDRHLARPSGVCFRAVDVDAPVAGVFRWLCQLRVAPYSYDWLDNFGRRSPRTRDPANEELAVGQRVMRIFRIVELERDRHLTILMKGSRLFGDVAVSYRVDARPGGARLVVKVLFRTGWWRPLEQLLVAGDFIMMRKQLLTLKALSEQELASVRPARYGELRGRDA